MFVSFFGSHKAFTVFAPDPKKRQDIQKSEFSFGGLYLKKFDCKGIDETYSNVI